MEDNHIFQEMEVDLYFFRKWRMISISGYGRGPQFQDMEEPIIKGMEDNLKFSGNRKQLKFSENGRLPPFNISYFFRLMWILNSQSKQFAT
jgi:hypothetical protein